MPFNTLSRQGAAFIRGHEGFVARWYLDPVGVPTIGVGFTWRSDSFREWWRRNKPGVEFAKGATMTRSEADDALSFLIDREYGAAVNRFLGKKVPQHVFDGTTSPVYNLGPGALNWKWAAAVKAGNYPQAAAYLRKTGVTAKGRRLAGLVRRRKEEAALIEHGVYAGVTASAPADPMADGVLARGERGEAVKLLQDRLATLGHYDGAIDGIFGYGTEAAVLKFQGAAGLKKDGYAGPKTLAALERAQKPVQPPQPVPAPSPVPEPLRPPVVKPEPVRRGFWAWLWRWFG